LGHWRNSFSKVFVIKNPINTAKQINQSLYNNPDKVKKNFFWLAAHIQLSINKSHFTTIAYTMKQSLTIIIIWLLSTTITYGFQARPFVISEITANDIIASDIQTSLLSARIPITAIQGTIPDIEPGVIAMIQCTPDRKIQINNANDNQVSQFNETFDRVSSFFVRYDEKFLQKIRRVYQQSPRENYVIKALLNNRLPAAEFFKINYNTDTTYTLAALSDYCFTKPSQLHQALGRDRFFLTTLGKDLTQESKIIPRAQRWANESMSMPVTPSTWTTTPSDPSGHTPTNVSTIRSNYLRNFEPVDKPRTIMHSFNGIRRAMEYFPADRIIIHHTAGRYQWTKEAGMEYMRSLQQYHGRTLGRGDIGYHFLIDGEGNVYEGRRGGMHAVGAHALGHNRGSVWISLMSDRFYSRDMLLSLIDTIVFIGKSYSIDVGAIDTFKNADLSGTTQAHALIAHKEIDRGKPLDPMIPMDLFRRIVNRVQHIWPLTDKVYEK
jgi:hypothetical protein